MNELFLCVLYFFVAYLFLLCVCVWGGGGGGGGGVTRCLQEMETEIRAHT